VKDRDGCRKQPTDQHDDVPGSPFGEQQRSEEPDDEDHDGKRVLGGWARQPAYDVVRDVKRPEQDRGSDVIVSSPLGFIGSNGGMWASYG